MNLSKGPSSYTKSNIMLELGNIEYMFSPWRLEWAQIFMKKHEFLRSGKEDCRNYNQGPAPRPRITVAGGEGDD